MHHCTKRKERTWRNAQEIDSSASNEKDQVAANRTSLLGPTRRARAQIGAGKLAERRADCPRPDPAIFTFKKFHKISKNADLGPIFSQMCDNFLLYKLY